MTNKRLAQGTMNTVAMGAIAAGFAIISQTDGGFEGILRGIVLIIAGAGIVFWREKRKEYPKEATPQ